MKDSSHSHLASVCEMFYMSEISSHLGIFKTTKKDWNTARKNTLKMRLLLFAHKEVHQYYLDCNSSKQEELQLTTHFPCFSFLCLSPPLLGLSSPSFLLHLGPYPHLVVLTSLLLSHCQLLLPQCLLLTFINLKTRALQWDNKFTRMAMYCTSDPLTSFYFQVLYETKDEIKHIMHAHMTC